MPAQKGKDLLLKVREEASTPFISIAGLRARSLAFNAETVDITHQESVGQWRELLASAGVRSARISGSGIFKDASSDALLRETFFTGELKTYQLVIPDFGSIEGPFQIAALEFSARHDSEVAFEIALESAGPLKFTAE